MGMEVITTGKEAENYYKERFGINITLLGDIILQSLENLYFRGVRLSSKKLYSKLADCGVRIRTGSVERTRMSSLQKVVEAEPPLLTEFGARMWYLTQPRLFSQEDLSFMRERFPEETALLYPTLQNESFWDYLMATNTYSSTTARARNEMAIRQALSEAPQMR